MYFFDRHPKKTIFGIGILLFTFLDLLLGYYFCPKAVGDPNAFYHHDLPRNYQGPRKWADINYPLVTNSLGFKDVENREVARSPAGRRILLLGDSFTEGIGLPFEKTFAGLLQERLRPEGVEVLNAGVISYSPKLYFLKTRYLLYNVNLKFDHLIVFVDLSDIQDEIRYETFVPSGRFGLSSYYVFNTVDSFLKQFSLTYYNVRKFVKPDREFLHDELLATLSSDELLVKDQEFLDNWSIERDQWAENPRVYEKWGRHGVELALGHMGQLHELCRRENIGLTVAVFPWPRQIVMKNLDSKNVEIWQDFCDKRGIEFINYYPVFIGAGAPGEVVRSYFLKNDVHWNENGHRLVADVLFDAWRQRIAPTGGRGGEAASPPRGEP